MRIIHGKYKGFQFPNFQGSNTRPTSDLVKESLFNSIQSFLPIENASVIDLFAGTGNIGLECLSRGAANVLSVDHMGINIKYMQGVKKNLQINNWEIRKNDALQFVSHNKVPAILIFADPPYDYPLIHDLVNRIISSDWFNVAHSVFILEHLDRLVFKQNNVFLNKQYGNTAFTCFASDVALTSLKK
ncbi:MAG: RsmD family RNA methyltransferase [Bacteroidia bacterium]